MIEACGTRYMAEQRAYMQLNNARVISKEEEGEKNSVTQKKTKKKEKKKRETK
jgi:hypothetical protein